MSKLTEEPSRTVQVDLPTGTMRLARTFPELKDYDPTIHCLEMVRPGFRLKDAPRLWNMRVLQEMKKLKISTLVSDPQLFCAWLDKRLKVLKLLKAEEEIT